MNALDKTDYNGWTILEREFCVKSPEQGAREGAPLIAGHTIETIDVAFADFVGGGSDAEMNPRILGIE